MYWNLNHSSDEDEAPLEETAAPSRSFNLNYCSEDTASDADDDEPITVSVEPSIVFSPEAVATALLAECDPPPVASSSASSEPTQKTQWPDPEDIAAALRTECNPLPVECNPLPVDPRHEPRVVSVPIPASTMTTISSSATSVPKQKKPRPKTAPPPANLQLLVPPPDMACTPKELEGLIGFQHRRQVIQPQRFTSEASKASRKTKRPPTAPAGTAQFSCVWLRFAGIAPLRFA